MTHFYYKKKKNGAEKHLNITKSVNSDKMKRRAVLTLN